MYSAAPATTVKKGNFSIMFLVFIHFSFGLNSEYLVVCGVLSLPYITMIFHTSFLRCPFLVPSRILFEQKTYGVTVYSNNFRCWWTSGSEYSSIITAPPPSSSFSRTHEKKNFHYHLFSNEI